MSFSSPIHTPKNSHHSHNSTPIKILKNQIKNEEKVRTLHDLDCQNFDKTGIITKIYQNHFIKNKT